MKFYLFFSVILIIGGLPRPLGAVTQLCEGMNNNQNLVFIDQHIKANARFPQMDAYINLYLASFLLKDLSLAKRFLQEPTQLEMNRLGRATNRLHKACGIPHRTIDAPDFDPKYKIEMERLILLTKASNKAVVKGVYRGIIHLATSQKRTQLQISLDAFDSLKYHNNPLARAADQMIGFVSDKKFTDLVSDLRKVGGLLEKVLSGEKMLAVSNSYLEGIRSIDWTIRVRSNRQKLGELMGSANQEVYSLVERALSDGMPEVDDEGIEFMMNSFASGQ